MLFGYEVTAQNETRYRVDSRLVLLLLLLGCEFVFLMCFFVVVVVVFFWFVYPWTTL